MAGTKRTYNDLASVWANDRHLLVAIHDLNAEAVAKQITDRGADPNFILDNPRYEMPLTPAYAVAMIDAHGTSMSSDRYNLNELSIERYATYCRETVRTLVQYGADLTRVDPFGMKPADHSFVVSDFHIPEPAVTEELVLLTERQTQDKRLPSYRPDFDRIFTQAALQSGSADVWLERTAGTVQAVAVSISEKINTPSSSWHQSTLRHMSGDTRAFWQKIAHNGVMPLYFTSPTAALKQLAAGKDFMLVKLSEAEAIGSKPTRGILNALGSIRSNLYQQFNVDMDYVKAMRLLTSKPQVI